MNRVILLFTIIQIFFISEIFSQQQISFNHLTVEDGLSQSSVTCIFQDKKGFMWFGTQDGLNRFDGYNFKVFKNDPSDSTSLSENFIFSIYEDSSGQLYVETRDGNLHQFNAALECFRLVSKENINLTNVKMSTVSAQLHEANGIIWKGGLGKESGLERTDRRTGKTTLYKHDPQNPSSLSNDKVYSIFRDRSGNLWIGTYNGLDKLDERTGKFSHYVNDPHNPQSLADNWVWPVFEDSRGNLWIGTVRSGLCLFNPHTRTFVNFKNDINDAASINDNFVFSIYEDRSGLIWVGTNLGGVSYFNPSTQAFRHYKHKQEDINSLSNNIVTSMLVDRTGNYWIGTRNGGLNKYNPLAKKFTHYLNNPSNSNSLISNSVQTLLEDKSGMLWIGSYGEGLNSYDPLSGNFNRYTHNPSDSASLTDNRIYSLIEATNGDIWVGTYGGGLNRIDRKTAQISNYKFKENDPASISSNETWSLALDDAGSLWIGTFGGGINVLDQASGSFRKYKNVPGDTTSIIDNSIVRIFKDSKGTMWFGTTKGLARYSWENDNFKNYTEKDGLANSLVLGIVEDGNGNLWLSTNNGLSKFNPETETFKNYYDKDGLQGNEFNQNAFAKDQKTGHLLFGGANGFNVFHPDSLNDNMFLPPIEFTGYVRYNTDDQEGKPIVEKGISERDSILLSYKDNIITLEFAALSFYNNFDNQYRYKLEGFNENWIQLGNNHTITFTNLSAGEYFLRVIGSNNDGVWNEEGASLNILVFPPFYKTTAAYISYFILFFGFLFGLRRIELNRREQKVQIRESALRIKATEAEKRVLETENERKTKELEEARQLQLSMLPRELPDLADLEIAAFMRTATEVGGDYYDFSVQENGVLNVAFGDATGHGLQAGTMVTLMKGFFTSESSKFGIIEFMTHCTKTIKEIKLGRILMSFSFLKIHKKLMQASCAGMPPIYVYHKENKQIEEILIEGMPLGAMSNASYNIVEKKLKSGDTILLLSDGLPEQMNNSEEMFDYDRVKKYFLAAIERQPSEIIEALIQAGDSWMNGRQQDDDITFVVIRIK